MKPFTKILNQSYTVVEEGRGNQKSFNKPRFWITGGVNPINIQLYIGAVKTMWQTYSKEKKPFYLFWSDPNTSKFHAGIVAGEYVPFTGTRLVLSHTTQLRDQHQEHLQHWIDQPGYLRNHWRSMNIQHVDALLKRVEGKKELDEQQQRDLDFINEAAFVVLDELHRYSKNDSSSIKMLMRILDYMLTQNLKLALGTSATPKGVTAVWQWAGSYIEQALFTYRTTPEELAVENWNPTPTSYIWADSHTDLEDTSGQQWGIDSISEDEVLDDLKANGKDMYFDKFERDIYVKNRIDAGVQHYFKNHLGESGLMAITGIQQATNAEKLYQPDFFQHGLECLAWNSDSKNNHPVYADDTQKVLDDLFDPEHPLKFVMICGMFQEGTNKAFGPIYQTNFSKNNPDRSIQGIARGKQGYIILDAPIMEAMPRNPYVADILEKLMEKAKEQMTPEELDSKMDGILERLAQIEAGITAEAMRQGSVIEDGKDPHMDIDFDALGDYLINNPDAGIDPSTQNGQAVLNGKEVFVYGVDHKGNLVKIPIDVGGNIHRELPQKAASAMDIFGVV